MRLVAISLVLLNVIYFLYELYGPDPVMESVGPAQEKFSLTLLSETLNTGSSKQRDRRFAGASDFSESLDGEYCNLVGKVESVADGYKVIEALSQVGIKSKLELVNRLTGELGFQVLTPPVSSLEKAFRKLKELKSESIEGSIITDRANTLRISLGVFSTIELAEEFRSTYDKEKTTVAETPLLERSFVILSESAKGADLQVSLESLTDYITLSGGQEACLRY